MAALQTSNQSTSVWQMLRTQFLESAEDSEGDSLCLRFQALLKKLTLFFPALESEDSTTSCHRLLSPQQPAAGPVPPEVSWLSCSIE